MVLNENMTPEQQRAAAQKILAHFGNLDLPTKQEIENLLMHVIAYGERIARLEQKAKD